MKEKQSLPGTEQRETMVPFWSKTVSRFCFPFTPSMRPVRQNVGRKIRYLQRRAMHGTVGKIEKTYRRGTIVEIPKAIPVKFGNTEKAVVRHAPHFFERFVQNDKLSGGVAAADQSADGLGIDHFAHTLLGRKMPCAKRLSVSPSICITPHCRRRPFRKA